MAFEHGYDFGHSSLRKPSPDKVHRSPPMRGRPSGLIVLAAGSSRRAGDGVRPDYLLLRHSYYNARTIGVRPGLEKMF